jgi:hypothetical protein
MLRSLMVGTYIPRLAASVRHACSPPQHPLEGAAPLPAYLQYVLHLCRAYVCRVYG